MPLWDSANLTIDPSTFESICEQTGCEITASTPMDQITTSKKNKKIVGMKVKSKKRYLIPMGISKAEKQILELVPLMLLRLMVQMFVPFLAELKNEGPLRIGFNHLHIEPECIQTPFKKTEMKNKLPIAKVSAYSYILNILDNLWKYFNGEVIPIPYFVEQLCVLIAYATLKVPMTSDFAKEVANLLSLFIGMRFNFANEIFNTQMVEMVYRLRLISKTATNDANDFTASQESKHLLADLVKLDDTSVKLPIGLRGKGVKEINAIELMLKLAYEITRDGWYGRNITHADIRELYTDIKTDAVIFQEALEYIEKNLDNPL
ncbi:hypothetical protein HK098_001393, partial [Nowakowskiella sp. JEL0407]